MNQAELREKCKFLKWNKGIRFCEIAEAIGMNRNSFYNFVSGRQVKLSYKLQQRLDNYIKEKICI